MHLKEQDKKLPKYALELSEKTLPSLGGFASFAWSWLGLACSVRFARVKGFMMFWGTLECFQTFFTLCIGALLKLKNNAVPTRWNLFRVFCVVSPVIMQMGCSKQIATKHTITKNIKTFGFFRFKMQGYYPIRSSRHNVFLTFCDVLMSLDVFGMFSKVFGCFGTFWYTLRNIKTF